MMTNTGNCPVVLPLDVIGATPVKATRGGAIFDLAGNHSVNDPLGVAQWKQRFSSVTEPCPVFDLAGTIAPPTR